MGDVQPLMSPWRLSILAGLVFLWLHAIACVDRRLRASGSSNPYLNLGVLIGGPFAWLTLWIVENRLHTRQGCKKWFTEVARRLRARSGGARRYDSEIITILIHADGRPASQSASRSFGQVEAFALTLARQMIDRAVKLEASDLLLDPKADQSYELRYRVDGLLRKPEGIDRDVALAAVNCFKIIAEMDIAERRRAQDGSLMALHDDREIKLRVATTGTQYGEKVTIRVLDSAVGPFGLDQLGMSERHVARLRRHLADPHGMILVCGPTGSGKTTTLYSSIKELADTGRNIITIEDPIEYALSFASQIAVNPKAGITFAGQLRHVLRQSPDVIMVGEIRDAETARIALQASETGHLVFSTLHANDAVTGLIRLTDLGIEPYLAAASINCILSQRLPRKLCTHCRSPALVSDRLRRAAAARNITLDKVYEPGGCDQCGQTGYRGREGIFELLEVSSELGEELKTRSTPAALRTAVREEGMTTMRQDGIAKVLNGTTSLAEVVRVAGS